MNLAVPLLALLAQDREGLDFFETRIRPVLADRCYECHSARAKKVRGGLLLDTREGLLKGGATGPAIVPGDPDRSRLMRAIRHEDEDFKMPPKEKLPAEQVRDFEAWVRRGAPVPAVSPAAAASGPRHWSFLPPIDPPLPPVKLAGWARTPVDRFILAKLEEKGLGPSSPADPRTLLRRATFDLIGLPPTPEEMDAFVGDASPTAFEKAIDRLLASPHFGERWGRHWLDVARYADTKGYTFQEERLFSHAHAYRDWVVRAFNEDMPYDRFVTLQLAADHVASGGSDLAAMGFLTGGRRFTKVVYEIIDDRIDVVTRGLLGLSVQCARCHDHKFDPIPIEDYYSLYGVFAGSREKLLRLPGPRGTDAFEEELRKRQEKLDRTVQAKRDQLLERLRSRVSEYLVAVLEVDRLPSEQFFEMLGPEAVNPVIVRRWEGYLYRTRREFHPVFAAWHALAALPERELAARAPEALDAVQGLNTQVAAAMRSDPPRSMREAAERYGRLLSGVHRKVKEKAALEPGEDDLRQVLYGPDSPIDVPEGATVEIERHFDDDARNELCSRQSELEEWISRSDPAPPFALVLEDRSVRENPRVFRRGNPANKGEEVPRRFLGVLGGATFSQGSGRLELARAIARPENPLTARVWVNRVWHRLFGAGLVRTPSDFGARGEPPTHPELLDFLARRFVEDGASLKRLIRALMLSAAYRQSSGDKAEARRVDPENALLWRMNRKRLDFESMRDAMLAASGRLDRSIGGRPVDITLAPSPPRRTVYGFIDRLELPNLYKVFDFASPDTHSPQRHATTVPPQALFLLNGPFAAEQAAHLVRRDDIAGAREADERLRRLYAIVFGRAPTGPETAAAAAFLGEPRSPGPAPAPPAWEYGTLAEDFQPLPHFTGKAWQSGPARPGSRHGWAALDAGGGRPGEGAARAVVRRWRAPREGTVSLHGAIAHVEKEGDGVTARIVHSAAGELGSWTLKSSKAAAEPEGVRVTAGDTLDFVVECRSDARGDAFTWSPVVRMGKTEWNASSDFSGPAPAPRTPWERLAQVLLLSNEFLFVD